MAFRRTFRRRTYRRRRFVPKYTRRKLIKGYLRKKARKGNTIVSKMRTVVQITPNDMINGCQGSFVNPHITFQGASGNVGPPADWSNYENLYDSYKICAIKLKWIPNVNQISFQGTGGTSAFVNGYMPGFIAADYDNEPLTIGVDFPTIPELNEYENCKSLNLYRPWKRYFRVPKYTSNPTSNDRPVVGLGNKGYFDLKPASDLIDYPYHGIWMFRTGAADFVLGGSTNEGLNVGTLIVTTYAAFKNRR